MQRNARITHQKPFIPHSRATKVARKPCPQLSCQVGFSLLQHVDSSWPPHSQLAKAQERSSQAIEGQAAPLEKGEGLEDVGRLRETRYPMVQPWIEVYSSHW